MSMLKYSGIVPCNDILHHFKVEEISMYIARLKMRLTDIMMCASMKSDDDDDDDVSV